MHHHNPPHSSAHIHSPSTASTPLPKEKPPTAKMWQCQACGAHMVANVKTRKFVLYASQSERKRRGGSFTSKKDRAYNVRQETTQQFGLYTSSILQDPLPCVPEAAGAAGAAGAARENARENATTTILSLESRSSATQHRFDEVDSMGWRGRGAHARRVQCSEDRNQVLPVTHYAHTVDASALRDGLHGADGFDGKGGSCGASGSSGGTGGSGGRGGNGQRGQDGKLIKRPTRGVTAEDVPTRSQKRRGHRSEGSHRNEGSHSSDGRRSRLCVAMVDVVVEEP